MIKEDKYGNNLKKNINNILNVNKTVMNLLMIYHKLLINLINKMNQLLNKIHIY
jgi:hypothetical protein